MIKLGSSSISTIKLGTTQVSKVYLGSTEVWSNGDADFAAYLAAGIANGSSMSAANQAAVEAFIVGCKADGVWTPIKASCLLCAWDSLAGALTPLVGTAPTNNGFVAGDYSRTTGLNNNGAVKYLNSNRSNNADAQNNNHNAVWATVLGNGLFIGQIGASVTVAGSNNLSNIGARSRNSAFDTATISAANFCGTSRSSSASFQFRGGGVTQTFTRASQPPTSANLTIQGYVNNGAYSTGRLSFYSLGESIDLALLEARLTTLMSSLS